MEEKPELWAPLHSHIKMHASYFKLFKEAINVMFYGDGPLPHYCRHYIAIMAACRHQCQYLVDVHKAEFKRCMGPESWLDGLQCASQKMRDLDLVNRLLAHRPWLLQLIHLQKLSAPPNNWSLSQLVQGAVILSHTHALCSFINGCGFAPLVEKRVLSATSSNVALTTTNGKESPLKSGTTNGNRAKLSHSDKTAAKATTPSATTNDQQQSMPIGKKLMAKCKSFTDTLSSGNTNDDNVEKLMACMQVLSASSSESSQEAKLQHFIAINRQNCEISPVVDEQQNGTVVCCRSECRLYTMDCDYTYSEFFRRSEGLATPAFTIHDYSWDDQGYSVISELYGEMSNLLDEKFKLIQDLTYHTMGGHKNVDTTKYRTAVWNYIQSLFGIRHDDYDYSEINKLLSRQMKAYVKTLCCYPERMKDSLRDSVMIDFLVSEKVHVNLMIFEARFQAVLLYLLRTVLRFLT